MKKNLLLIVLAVVLAASGAMTVQAADKVQVCHLPPGNPDLPETANANAFHTITVTEKNLPSHLAHGDLPGSCSESCDILCDDGDACTVDHHNDCEENGCLTTAEAVDCDDSLLCTNDSCDPQGGCLYAPIVCDDGDNCTIDACNPADGQCTAPLKDCGTLGLCLSETGDCDYPCDGISCDPIDQCHMGGSCILPGDCVDGDPRPNGTPCNDGDAITENDQCTAGVCSGSVPLCPCDFTETSLDMLFQGSANITCFDLLPDAYLVYDPSVSPNRIAILEYVTTFNLPGQETWPVCGSTDSFGSEAPGSYINGLTSGQAAACEELLLAYGAVHCN